MSIEAYDDLICTSLAPVIELGVRIGDLVEKQIHLVKEAFDTQRSFIEFASKSTKPSSDQELLQLLKPTSDLDIREKNRKHEQFNHLSAVSEGIAALSWVAVAKTPAPFVKEMADSAQFYTNKVLIAYKDKPAQEFNIEWAKKWIQFLIELQQYIRKNHTTGLIWAKTNPSGQILVPPPPPPPEQLFGASPISADSDAHLKDARAALFASINQGLEITKGLRKVAADEMTHKNPNLRVSSVVTDNEKSKQSNIKAGPLVKGPEKFELDGKKWLVENLNDKKELSICETQMTQSVNVYRCDNCILFVKGKINSITIDSCKKFSIVFDSIVSFVEFIRCQNIQVQAMETLPTLTMDCVDNIEIFLSPKSLNVELVSSKSSSINVSVINESGDYVEHALPEQLKSTWDGKGFKTVPISLN